MEYQENFKFLNLQIMQKKNQELKENERKFIVLNLLDNQNNPCKFFIFKTELVEKLLSLNLVGLQDLLIRFRLSYSNNIWNVNVLDIEE